MQLISDLIQFNLGYSNALDELHCGHYGITGPGNRTPKRGSTEEEALWTNQATHFTLNDEEHLRPRHLPTLRPVPDRLCWLLPFWHRQWLLCVITCSTI